MKKKKNSTHLSKTRGLTLKSIFRTRNQYFAKASPGRKGDYIEFIADMDLLVALATCPQGDVSMAVGQEVPESMCYPLGVEVYRSTPP
ncbi:unnamed protein product [Timema podura]|uniref:DUF1989 domain-containing protein n=1 Tax=Timema podura TaxID=61482 RepID=A0ABN7P9G8_TIMPD|nr:unnamed protein product [Timema podura]